MTSPRYFGGTATQLGQVSTLSAADFPSLVTHLRSARRLPLTRDAFHLLPKRERDQLKRVAYITPATFSSAQSPRKTEHAQQCNLLCLDIDNAEEAQRLLSQRWEDLLPGIAYVAWHTVSSTEDAPRLRVVVSAEGIPAERYDDAVKTVGEMLGLTTITHESLVPVQPMFLPTVFEGEDAETAFVYCRPEGSAFTISDIVSGQENSLAGANASAEGLTMGDLEYLRTPLDGITVEDVKQALEHLDPDCSMQQWIEVAAGLKHQFGDAGLELWDEWSAKGTKYDASGDETEYRWSTLKAQPLDRAPITIRSVFRLAQARGWSNPTLIHRMHIQVTEWLKSPSRSTEEILDEGLKKIAKAGPLIGTLEKKSLLATFKEVLNARQITVSIPDVKNEVKKLELESAKSTGIPPWAKGLCYITSSNQFYRYTVDRKFSPEALDLMYATPAIGDEKPPRPRDYLMAVAQIPQVEALRYEPAQGEKRFYAEEGVPYCNIYIPSYAKPDKDRAEEAGAIFTDHLNHLIKEESNRRLLLDFLCYHVINPGKKIRWAVLLQGGQGCGKTFLSVAMSAVLGRRNVRKLAATDVLNGQFNGWAYGQQLTFMEEIRIIGNNRFGIMDRLKPSISDDQISLRELHQPARTVPNLCNYIMFTNHHDALAVSDGDRRYFVIQSPLQTPEQIMALGPDYFPRLFKLVNENAGGLRAWMEQHTFSTGFEPEGRAPLTAYLADLAVTSASPLAASVVQVIADQMHPLVASDLLSLPILRSLVSDTNVGPFSDQALGLVLLEHGWSRATRIRLGDSRHTLWTKGFKGRNPALAAAQRMEVL